MADIEYQFAEPSCADEISALVDRVFNEFIAPGYSEEGVKTFLEYSESAVLGSRLEVGDNFGFVAKDGERIAGYIEIRDDSHVSLMFVDPAYHRKGICGKLLEMAKDECKKRNPDIEEMSVHSSPYAVEVYERLGFSATDKEQEKNGIKYIPMSRDEGK